MKRKLFAVLWLACLALAVPSAGTLRAAKYPPGQRWREMNRGLFTILFPTGRSDAAEAALARAEILYETLADFWHIRLPGRVRVVLDDSTDLANGFATFYPFNLVGVNLAEAPPDSELSASRGCLDLVLAHELTHIFTLNAGAPLFRAGRRLFGSLPVFYPAAQMPPWAVEGLAVEGESRFTNDGRLNHPPYRLMLDAARRDNRFPGWESAAGLPSAWPGPTSRYLFGAGFMEFLSEKYGVDSLRRYVERASSRLVTFGSSRDFKKLFGRPLGKLWQEYAESIALARRPAPEPLTAKGFSNRYPCALGTDSLAFYHRDYRKRGEVSLLNLDSGKSEALFKMDAVNGLSGDDRGEKLLLSAGEYFHAFSDFSDLYEYDVKKARLTRLSRGGRLSHPARRGNSEWIYCVQRRNGRSRLALFSMKKREARSISLSFAGLAQPSISPDGRRIAAAAKPAGGPWGIAVFLESGALDRFLAVTGSDLSQPRWQGNEKLLFIVSGKETSRLASYSLDADSVWRLEDPQLTGLRQFDLSRDGREIFFTCYGGRGEEIARRLTAFVPLSPMEISVTPGIPEAKTSPAPTTAPRSRPYRFWRDLLPRWWSPALRMGGDEYQAGVMTGGQDALGIHRFSLEGYYGFASRRANVLFQYVYDGLFPTLSLSYRDSSDYFRFGSTTSREEELKLASFWPLRIRRRSQIHAYADLHLGRRSSIFRSRASLNRGHFNGFRFGIGFNSAREYYDSISPADGTRITLQSSIQPAGLGNEFASRSIQLDLRHYISLFRPGVLAWRLALAKGWWDRGRFYYAMGGQEGEGGSGLGDGHPFDLLRGFSSEYQYGDRGYLLNLEYRLPLFKVEKALLPAVSLDRVSLNLFFDTGRLWNGPYAKQTAYSAGGEAVLRLAFGGAAAYDLAFGVAHGFGPEKHYRLYLRTGRSF